MRESIANSMVFSIIMIVIAVSTSLVLFSLSYSKTFKVKNKVIDIIESHGTFDETVQTEIDDYMRQVGYSSFKSGSCGQLDGLSPINNMEKQNYMYCIYEFDTVKGKYYTVRVYMTYNLPIISDFINIRYSIRGDTSVLFNF